MNKQQNLVIFIFIIIISIVVGFGVPLLSLNLGYMGLMTLVLIIFIAINFIRIIPDAFIRIKSLRSKLTWWHLLWLLVLVSSFVFRQRDIEDIYENLLDFWTIFRISVMATVAIVLLARLATKKTNWVRPLFQGIIGWLALYTIICVVSSIWSVYPMWSLYRSIEYLVDVILITSIVISIKSAGELKTLFDWNGVLLTLYTTSVWLGLIIWPEQAIYHGVGIIGVQVIGLVPAISANGVGNLGAFISIIAFTRMLFHQQGKRFYLAIFLFGLMTMIVAQSRSALTGFIIAIPVILFSARRIGIIVLVVITLSVILISSNFVDVFWQYFLRGQSLDMFKSLSGRVNWWEFGWEFIKKEPFLGYGAYAGARFTVLAQFGNSTSSAIHNTWIETLLGIGFVGVLPLVAAFLSIWRVLLHSVRNIYRGTLVQMMQVEAIGLFTILSVRSFFTSAFIWHPALTFFLIVGYSEFLRRNSETIIKIN